VDPAEGNPQYDILIRNARLLNAPGKQMSIAVADGKIAAIEEAIDGQAPTEIDAKGMLVSESFVNPHLHLCKVFTLAMMDEEALKEYHGAEMGKAMTAIELAARVKEKYDQSWIVPNARKAVAQAVIYGCTHMRAFADVDSRARLEGVKALIQVRDEFQGVVDVQVVAFAQDGILREPGAADLMHEAMALGADVAGGIPWIEYTDADVLEHVRIVFDLAVEFNKDVSMLVDDAGDAGLRSLEAMALEAIRRGWQGRALAHHARAMALYPTPYFQKVSALLNKARIGLVSDPHTGPLHARVRELLANGNLVSLGQDDISDAYYPFGRNNMLEIAFLASHLLWFTSRQDIHTLYDMITVNAARCIGLEEFEIKVGASANLVVLGQPDVIEALRFHQAPLHTISHGRLVDAEKYRSIAFASV
jgi:cytosine/creatinine deaminase